MSLSSQLPPIPLAQASATLRALAQAAGQTVEAKVLGPLPNGAVQVQIGRQVLSLQMPEVPPAGTTLVLALQQAEGQVKVSLVATRPPQTAAGASAQTPVSPGNAPATSIQLSPAALSGAPAQAPVAAAPAGTVAAPVAPQQTTVMPAAVPVSVAVQPGQAAGVPAPVGATPAAPGPVTAPAAPQVTVSPVAGAAVGSSAAQPQAVVPVPVAGQSQPSSIAATQPVAAAVIAPVAAAAPGVVRPVVPYAAAAPAPVPSAASGPATNPMQTVGQSLAGSMVGQHAPQSNLPNPVAAQVLTPSPAQPQNPAVALSQMVQQSLPQQNSVIGLTTALANVIGRVALPEPVVKAAQQVLGQRVALDSGKLDGPALQTAVKASGIFQEAMLAAGQGKAAGGDMKTALLGLQRQLGAWLGDQAPVEQLSQVPPPLKGLTPRARLADVPLPDLPDDPELAGKVLLERTEAALSRLRLHQNASLPEPQVHRNEAQWSLDLPVTVAGHQALLQMQIHRDPEGDATRPEDRGWQVRFAINLSEAGEVGAQISLRGQTAGVLLWADDVETAEALARGVDALREELAGVGLMPGAVVVRTGAPVAAPVPSAAAGNLLDAVR